VLLSGNSRTRYQTSSLPEQGSESGVAPFVRGTERCRSGQLEASTRGAGGAAPCSSHRLALGRLRRLPAKNNIEGANYPERVAYDAEAAVSYAAEVWAGRIWREEAVSYANEFLDEKNAQRFWIRGGSHWEHHCALVYTIEAARQLNSGADGADTAIRLLEMALEETRHARRQYQER
jgi:hypothetical protein